MLKPSPPPAVEALRRRRQDLDEHRRVHDGQDVSRMPLDGTTDHRRIRVVCVPRSDHPDLQIRREHLARPAAKQLPQLGTDGEAQPGVLRFSAGHRVRRAVDELVADTRRRLDGQVLVVRQARLLGRAHEVTLPPFVHPRNGDLAGPSGAALRSAPPWPERRTSRPTWRSSPSRWRRDVVRTPPRTNDPARRRTPAVAPPARPWSPRSSPPPNKCVPTRARTTPGGAVIGPSMRCRPTVRRSRRDGRASATSASSTRTATKHPKDVASRSSSIPAARVRAHACTRVIPATPTRGAASFGAAPSRDVSRAAQRTCTGTVICSASRLHGRRRCRVAPKGPC